MSSMTSFASYFDKEYMARHAALYTPHYMNYSSPHSMSSIVPHVPLSLANGSTHVTPTNLSNGSSASPTSTNGTIMNGNVKNEPRSPSEMYHVWHHHHRMNPVSAAGNSFITPL
jgi:hypothetical protein